MYAFGWFILGLSTAVAALQSVWLYQSWKEKRRPKEEPRVVLCASCKRARMLRIIRGGRDS